MVDSNTIVYVTRDIDRALGSTTHSHIHIITNATPQARAYAASGGNCSLIEHDFLLSTIDLLKRQETLQHMNAHPHAGIVVFKPTEQVERFITERSWTLLHPSAELASVIEGKITQLEWLGELVELLPLTWHGQCADMPIVDLPAVAQFNISHTGNGTLRITEQTQLDTFKAQFPQREIRLMHFIEGPTLTSNSIIAPNDTLHGAISYQITGLQPFTDNDFSATIGNDFALAATLLSEDAKLEYASIAGRVADTMRASGWKGAFGIDCLWSESEQKMYLLEINAREPASLPFESLLQQSLSEKPTMMDWHLAALQNKSLDQQPIRITSGAQLVLRAQHSLPGTLPPSAEIVGSDVYGTEFARFRTPDSFMQAHGVLNDAGAAIADHV